MGHIALYNETLYDDSVILELISYNDPRSFILGEEIISDKTEHLNFDETLQFFPTLPNFAQMKMTDDELIKLGIIDYYKKVSLDDNNLWCSWSLDRASQFISGVTEGPKMFIYACEKSNYHLVIFYFYITLHYSLHLNDEIYSGLPVRIIKEKLEKNQNKNDENFKALLDIMSGFDDGRMYIVTEDVGDKLERRFILTKRIDIFQLKILELRRKLGYTAESWEYFLRLNEIPSIHLHGSVVIRIESLDEFPVNDILIPMMEQEYKDGFPFKIKWYKL